MRLELTTLTDYSDEALLAEIRRVANQLEHEGKRLTHKQFNLLSRVHSTTIGSRFGSWQTALDRAGVSQGLAPRFRPLGRDDILRELIKVAEENPRAEVTRETIALRLNTDANNITRRFGLWRKLLADAGLVPVPLGRRYTDVECFENILKLWTHFGRQPHYSELNRPPSVVGAKAYTRRWGGWRRALAAFMQSVNEGDDSPGQINATEGTSSGDHAKASLVVPRSINLAVRYRVLVRDRFRCVICGASPAKDLSVELHIDHIVPWSKGGSSSEDNLRVLCHRCNLGKGDKHEVA